MIKGTVVNPTLPYLDRGSRLCYDFSINQSRFLWKLDSNWILFQAQAKFIDEFTVESDAGRIWSNVVVVAKGKVRLPKER